MVGKGRRKLGGLRQGNIQCQNMDLVTKAATSSHNQLQSGKKGLSRNLAKKRNLPCEQKNKHHRTTAGTLTTVTEYCKVYQQSSRIKYGSIGNIHNGRNCTTISFPHATESWLASKIPKLYCYISFCHLLHVKSYLQMKVGFEQNCRNKVWYKTR